MLGGFIFPPRGTAALPSLPKQKARPMVGLLDIAPLTKSVTVNGKDIEVFGVSAKGVASLFASFPQFRDMFISGKIDTQALVESAPDVVAAIIACSTGTPGNKKAEQRAALLPLEAQLDLLDATVALTMPNGAGPFAKRLTGLLNSMQSGTGNGSAAGETPVPSTGTATATS